MAAENAFEDEMANHKNDSTLQSTIRSAFELLEATIEEDGTNQLKILDLRLDQLISFRRDVELEEKAAAEAKQEAATSGLAILAKVEALKQEQHRLEERNATHARKVYEQRAVLATDLKELQLRLSGVYTEGHKSLGDFEEMLRMRWIEAVGERKLAVEQNQRKILSAQLTLAIVELQIKELVKESNELKEEEVENSKLQVLFKEREKDVDILEWVAGLFVKNAYQRMQH